MPRALGLRTPGSLLVPVIKQRLLQEWRVRFKKQQESKREQSKIQTVLLVRPAVKVQE